VTAVMVFHSAYDDFDAWQAALRLHLPDVRLSRAEDIADPADVRYALVWKPPIGFFTAYPRLALVINLGAGVDALMARDDLPDLPITRLSDPDMARMMAGFVLFAVTRHARDIPALERAQRQKRWHYIHPRDPGSVRVGILGLGELGLRAATECARQGYRVSGWSRTPKTVEGVETAAGLDALPNFLTCADILVCLLPQTPETIGLLDAGRLAMLPKGAVFINVSRGSVVDEAALVEALQSGAIGGATLDVFAVEPLPETSPLWQMDNVLITPHLASIALAESAARQIADNVRRVEAGEPVLSRVDPRRGY